MGMSVILNGSMYVLVRRKGVGIPNNNRKDEVVFEAQFALSVCSNIFLKKF